MMLSPSARMPCRELNTLWISTVALWCGVFVTSAFGAPTKLDDIASPPRTSFPLETQPKLFSSAFAAALDKDNGFGNGDGSFLISQPSAINSYGNPIEALKPIDTPDGRKVVNAQGVQFEIPNYASGITEIKRPSDDLLPPFIDPIAVAVPNYSSEDTAGTVSLPDVVATAFPTTSVDVENAEMIELNPEELDAALRHLTDYQQTNGVGSLPAYITELNDPDIAGPVDYKPREDGSYLKVIAWDLLPPLVQEPQIITAENNVPKHVTGIENAATHNIKVSLPSGQSFNTESTLSNIPNDGKVTVVLLNHPNSQTNSESYRDNVHFANSKFTTTTPKTIITRSTWPTTTTTPHPITEATKTTTITTKIPATTTTTTSAPFYSDDFYKLANGDSYTIPEWLADIDDPDLDAAVTYVPENIYEYNDTISQDILPPLEPFTDLKNIDLPAPVEHFTSTTTTKRPHTSVSASTTRRSTTTRRSQTVSSGRQHWVRVHPTTAQTATTTASHRSNSFSSRFTTNPIAQTRDSSFISSSTSPTSKFSVITTTPRSHSTTNAHVTSMHHQKHHFNSFNHNLPTTTADPITNAELESTQTVEKSNFPTSNPFLGVRINGARPFVPLDASKPTAFKSTEENPFDSATLPSWLADFDYSDLGPGVPFTLNSADSNAGIFNGFLPPSQMDTQTADTTKSFVITSSPTTINSFQVPPNSAFANTTTTRTFAFNNTPSKFTTTATPFRNHNPFVQVPNSKISDQDKAATLPAAVFIPPPVESDSDILTETANYASNTNTNTNNANVNTYHNQQQHSSQHQPHVAANAGQIHTKNPSSSSFNTNFAAPFEQTITSGNAVTATSVEQQLSNPTKTTFSKSNDGKVITNNILTTTGDAITSTIQKDLQQQISSGSNSNFGDSTTSFNKATTPSGVKGGDVRAASDVTGKYTGGFGGSPGVLESGIGPTPNRAIVHATLTTPTPTSGITSALNKPAGTAAVVTKYEGTFGGPPGVLTPFDNIKTG